MAINGGGSSSSYDIETNWRVAASSLKSNVVFESLSEDYPVDATSPDSVDAAATKLVLKPLTADSGPCEITTRLSQKHEIRQIYVRSTARVYEIYYAQSSQSDSEYLCTVRCSIAERDEEVLRAFDIESAENYENSSAEIKEEKLSAEGNSGTSEDEWVEVKVLDSFLEHKINSLSNKNTASVGKVFQDLYEATAEISDLDPCISVTLRFLSLQNKSCVYIDEVYIFADPVSAIDTENQSQDVKGSAGSSLMAMLVPTLLQLSKSGMSQIQGQKASSDLRKGNKFESQSKATDLTDITNHQYEKGSGDQECGNLKRVDGSMTVPTENQLCHKILDGEKFDNPLDKIDPPYGRIEKMLEQLVSRVGRIEEVCLRFEENMLKPLNSMEMRIQKVEQQLEVLVNNSRHSGLPHCTRIAAPSFSCTSNCSSFHDEGRDYQPCCRAPESEKEKTCSDLSNASNGVSKSANVPHLFPSLVVTAPDFTYEDHPNDDGLELLKISPVETKKKSLIDDVLASSLSGFLSSSTGNLSDYKEVPSSSNGTSEVIGDKFPSENVEVLASGVELTNNINAKEEPSRYTQVLTIMAPEFTSEENAGEELLNYDEVSCVALSKFSSKVSQTSNNVTLEGNENGCPKVTADLSDMNRDTLVSNQASIRGNVASAPYPEANCIISDDLLLGVAVAEGHFSERSNSCRSKVSNLDNKGEETEESISIDVCQTIRESDQREPPTCLFPENNDEFEWFLGDKTDGSPISAGTVGGGTEYVAVEVPDMEILQNLSQPSSASLVDFGIPILDVKFTLYEDSRTQLPLEALLDDEIDLNVEAGPPQDNDAGDAYAQGSNFIDINEEDETGNSQTGKPLEALLDHAIDLNVESDPQENGAGDAYAEGANFIDINEEDETGSESGIFSSSSSQVTSSGKTSIHLNGCNPFFILIVLLPPMRWDLLHIYHSHTHY